MPVEDYRIFALGDCGLTVEFGREISVDLNKQALLLAEQIDTDPFPGFVESVPAYAATSIFYNPLIVRKTNCVSNTAFDAVKDIIKDRLNYLDNTASVPPDRHVEIPVRFGGDEGPDLEEISGNTGLAESEIIDHFASKAYRVYMLGFLPGFAYMGDVDDLIAVPRRPTPRLKVPKGSVGIAGKQTGIYPLESPGGWQLIGRAEMEMFTPESPEICALRPGDSVKFIPV